MAKFVLTCCSTADMTREYFEKRDIPFICFHFTMDGKEYIATAGMNSLFGVQNYVKNSEAPLDERIMVLVP